MARILSKEEWFRRKRMRKLIGLVTTITLFIIILIFVGLFAYQILNDQSGLDVVGEEEITETLLNGKMVNLQYLTPNDYSRPRTKLKKINAVVIHYTANPGTSAENNRSYFEGLAEKQTTYASSHYIIGLEGEIIQCIPMTEQAYASNDRNDDTISIECCHPDETGQFKEETYDSMVSLTAAICLEFDLEKEDIIRHYDITGKLCPLYYVVHEDAWEAFKDEVMIQVNSQR